MKNIVIIGAGGVGKEAALIIEQINEYQNAWNILGFVDDNASLHNKVINGYLVLGGTNHINDFENIYTVCAIADYQIKKRIVSCVNNSKIKFANIIHPSVHIPKTTSIGEDVIIYANVIISTNISIGNHVIICPKCGIGHETAIEDYVSLLWNVNISGNDLIEEGCLVGSGSTVIQNKKICRGSTIGAGSVVIRDIPENCVAVGCPAKSIKDLTKPENHIISG